MISLGQLKHIQRTDPRLYEAITSLQDSINKLNNYHGIDTSGNVKAPATIGGLNVTAANGVFRVTITDRSSVNKGITYFLEHDTSSSFPHPVTVDLGASRSWVDFLGSATFFFRAYSSYPLSPPSSAVVFGGATPTGVAGGGAIAAPAPLTGQGTGTSSLPNGGQGFGNYSIQPPGQRLALK